MDLVILCSSWVWLEPETTRIVRVEEFEGKCLLGKNAVNKWGVGGKKCSYLLLYREMATSNHVQLTYKLKRREF